MVPGLGLLIHLVSFDIFADVFVAICYQLRCQFLVSGKDKSIEKGKMAGIKGLDGATR